MSRCESVFSTQNGFVPSWQACAYRLFERLSNHIKVSSRLGHELHCNTLPPWLAHRLRDHAAWVSAPCIQEHGDLKEPVFAVDHCRTGHLTNLRHLAKRGPVHRWTRSRARWRDLADRAETQVEALFAELKNQIGLHRLRLRRLRFAREQFFLAPVAQNSAPFSTLFTSTMTPATLASPRTLQFQGGAQG